MKPIRFHPDADVEMVDAAVWYEFRQEDLGKRFLTAVQDALNKIKVNPGLYPFVDGGCPSLSHQDLSLRRLVPDHAGYYRGHGDHASSP